MKDLFKGWDPEKRLEEFSANAVRFGRGFLCAEVVGWFPGLKSHWLPLFHALGVEVRVVDIARGFDFPDHLDRVVAVECDEEGAVIGMEQHTEDLLVSCVAPQAIPGAAEVIIDYLERRLLASLSKSWAGNNPLKLLHPGEAGSAEVEVTGVVTIHLEIKGEPAAIYLGLGSKMLEKLDSAWLESLARQGAGDKDVHTISVQIAELVVPPEFLIDSLKPGAAVDLDLPASDNVFVRLDGRMVGRGKLGHYNGRFAVHLLEELEEEESSEGTRLQLELARMELDAKSAVECRQIGSVFLTRTTVDGDLSLLVAGEPVGRAKLGEADGRFRLSILR